MTVETADLSDVGFLERHRSIWEARPELRSVYHQLFDQLLGFVGPLSSIVELGAGPGFFKEYFPKLIASDVIPTSSVDVVCDGCAMPFRSDSVGAIVMLDVLHHLPRPLEFITEAARVLSPGGMVAMIEPWITPASYLLYRFFHHEDCTLRIDIRAPFDSAKKNAFDGNATIPFNLVEHAKHVGDMPLTLVHVRRFLALPYLATLGFQRASPMPEGIIGAADSLEKMLGPIGRWNATRALIVWKKSDA